MAILWAGLTDIECAETNGATSYNPGTWGYRSDYVRSCVRLLGVGAYMKTPVVADQSDVWFSVRVIPYWGPNHPFLSFLRDGATVFQILYPPAGQDTLVRWAISRLGSTLASSTSPLGGGVNPYPAKMDVHYLKSASGYVRVYQRGELNPCVEFSGDTTSWGDIDQVVMHCDVAETTNPGIQGSFWSEMIMSTLDTRRMCVQALYPTGAGASSAWNGLYSAIDEQPTDTTDYISSDTAGQEVSFALPNLHAGLFDIQQVRFSVVAAKGVIGPTQLQLGLRIGGVNYFSAAQALDPAWSVRHQIWDVQPNDSQPWDSANIDSMEIAFKSVT